MVKEFAMDIGNNLLAEIRRLQSLLTERDKAIQDMKEERDDLEKTIEALKATLKQQERSSGTYTHRPLNPRRCLYPSSVFLSFDPPLTLHL